MIVPGVASQNTGLCCALKGLVFVLCVTGFVYQLTDILTLFYLHPTLINMEVKEIKEFMEPAVTICNANPIKRSKYCEKYPLNCQKISNFESLCKKQPQFCHQNSSNAFYPKRKVFGWELGRKDVLELSPQQKDFILGEVKFDGPFYFETVKLTDLHLIPCFIYNFQNPKITTLGKGNSILFSINLNVEEDELFDPTFEPLALLAVHPLFDTVDPEYDGVPMQVGKRYDVHINLIEEHLLPFPFITDCINYEEMWRRNNKTGPRSKQMCLERCRDILHMNCSNCSKSVFSKLEHRCRGPQMITCHKQYEAILNKSQECAFQCKHECKKRKYRYRVQEWPTHEKEDTLSRKFIEVRIIVDTPEVTIIEHVPRYINVEYFSYIGGLLGLWLGLSIWSGVLSFLSIPSWTRIFAPKRCIKLKTVETLI